MPRARSPNREKAFALWKASKGKRKNKDIAAELGVSESQISRWRKEDAWDESVTKKFTNRKSKTKRKEKESFGPSKNQKEKTAKAIAKSLLENQELTEKQKLFCLFYLDNRNATQAYLKAYKCAYITARVEGSRILTKPAIQAELTRLKEIRNIGLALDGLDIVERMMRIGFADITDFVQFRAGIVNVYSSDMIDGGIVSEIKQTQSGVSIKLEDRMKALMWLADYFELNPMHQHKKRFDEKMLELKEKGLALQEYG